MTELPDFSGYEPVELSQVKQGDVVAAVFAGTIAHGAVTYATKYGVDLDSGFCATDKTDYKFFKAPVQLPTGDCAVVQYTDKAGTGCRAVFMGDKWAVFESNVGLSLWGYSLQLTAVDLQNDMDGTFTVIFEGVKK